MTEFVLHPQLLADTQRLGDLPLSRVLLAKDSRYPWLILVPRRADIQEIHWLTAAEQVQLIQESSALGRLMEQWLAPDKINVAALGNMVPQLHLHHIARFRSDAAWPGPIWGKHQALPYTDAELVQVTLQWQERLAELPDFLPG
ncbi:HIT domain-containing protein [Zobellella maritima]|uniref:HIT domain-containing protein n=1 Tax=Zobellella maritima TaxID=2059725 RepID=UPI000E30A947|nr:HIT domain-containing protein [Zobellella maritima]